VAEGTAETWWCRRCGKPALLVGEGEPELRRAVHADSGREVGEDGHGVAPIDSEPPLWRAARELAEEFGAWFTFDARFGFLRADRADLPPGVVAAHFTADGKDEMRGKLVRALIAAGQDPPAAAEAAGEEPEGATVP
jgi:hypothetical protein